MLVVKIELWPYGDEDEAREIARMVVANLAPSRWSTRYGVAAASEDGRTWQRATVRRRDRATWVLLPQALSRVLGLDAMRRLLLRYWVSPDLGLGSGDLALAHLAQIANRPWN